MVKNIHTIPLRYIQTHLEVLLKVILALKIDVPIIYLFNANLMILHSLN